MSETNCANCAALSAERDELMDAATGVVAELSAHQEAATGDVGLAITMSIMRLNEALEKYTVRPAAAPIPETKGR